MIKQKTNNIEAMRVNGLEILAVYMRGRLIWAPGTDTDKGDHGNDQPTQPDEPENPEIILSCYFNGYWIDEYPWTDDTPWTD